MPSDHDNAIQLEETFPTGNLLVTYFLGARK
jgi:hypothetical protein